MTIPCGRLPSLTLMLTLTALLYGCYDTAKHKETRTLTREHIPETALRVETENGSISVLQSDRENVEIVAHLRAISEERLKEAEVVAERTEDGVLTVHTRWPDNKRCNNEGTSFEILVPDANGIVLETSNGKLTLSGLSGEADLHTSNGAIVVTRHGGPVSAGTSNGAITLTAVAGPVQSSTSNGKIVVEEASGAVRAGTSNGGIRVALSPESPGPVNLQTSNGGIELEIGPGFSSSLDLRTSNGSFRIAELPGATRVSSGKNDLKLAFGAAKHESFARTSNGSISLKTLGPAPKQE